MQYKQPLTNPALATYGLIPVNVPGRVSAMAEKLKTRWQNLQVHYGITGKVVSKREELYIFIKQLGMFNEFVSANARASVIRLNNPLPGTFYGQENTDNRTVLSGQF